MGEEWCLLPPLPGWRYHIFPGAAEMPCGQRSDAAVNHGNEVPEMYDFAAAFVRDSQFNRVPEEKALRPDLAGMAIFGDPLFGSAPADDEAFSGLRKGGVVGSHFMLPCEWLPSARTVISFFLPFTERVRKSNAGKGEPSQEWLHGRIEGQSFLDRLSNVLAEHLRLEGFEAVVPSLDGRFRSCTGENRTFQDGEGQMLPVSFTSNWSERHVAYVCGMGSFCLSRGLITERGVAGRFGSLVTNLALPVGVISRPSLYQYCTRCGACAERCPAGAISLEGGKDHVRCSEYLDVIRSRHSPWYGCGKCQAGVPCESGVPAT